MTRSTRRGFTLIELLVVITIIALLTGVILPVYTKVQLVGQRTQSLSNMKQLGTGFINYCNDNNGNIPGQGDSNPSYSAAADSGEVNYWYNAVPRAAGSKGLADFYHTNPADFYTRNSLFYVPAAKYSSKPAMSSSQPPFAVAYNSKLLGNFSVPRTMAISSLLLQDIVNPSQVCIFQESGLVGETKINSSQSSYNGQPSSFASRTVARYNGTTIITFADGHAGVFAGSEVVCPVGSALGTPGKAYYPQNNGQVYWTAYPDLSPN